MNRIVREQSVESKLPETTAHTNQVAGHSRISQTLQKHLQESGKSIYQLGNDSGVDAAYIWRLIHSERREVSREILILLSLGFVLDVYSVEQVTHVANQLLDAGGYRMLRPP